MKKLHDRIGGRVPQDRIKYYRITPPPANWEGLTHVTALNASIWTFILRLPKKWSWFIPSILDTLYNVYSMVHYIYVWESVSVYLCTRSQYVDCTHLLPGDRKTVLSYFLYHLYQVNYKVGEEYWLCENWKVQMKKSWTWTWWNWVHIWKNYGRTLIMHFIYLLNDRMPCARRDGVRCKNFMASN